MKKNTLFYRIGGLLLGSVLVSGCGTATGTGNPEDELPVQCRVESAADPVQLSKRFPCTSGECAGLGLLVRHGRKFDTRRDQGRSLRR